jgi:uncharacterized YigZ family protein
MSSDERRVPALPGQAQVRERASRFLAFAFPCASAGEAREAVARLAREYHDATHVAFAWRVGTGDSAAARASDAGEPSGTAGKPIAVAIESAGVTDVCVAVVRYFGGTKLGPGGLARAYREAAARALDSAGARPVFDTRTLVVSCPHARLGAVQRLLRPPGIAVVSEDFGEESRLTLAVRRSLVARLTEALEEARISFHLTGD